MLPARGGRKAGRMEDIVNQQGKKGGKAIGNRFRPILDRVMSNPEKKRVCSRLCRENTRQAVLQAERWVWSKLAVRLSGKPGPLHSARGGLAVSAVHAGGHDMILRKYRHESPAQGSQQGARAPHRPPDFTSPCLMFPVTINFCL